jgi:hypothetical protein
MKQQDIYVGDVVQIDPDYDETFGGCFMLVTNPEPWGARGIVRVPGKGDAKINCEFEDMEYIGHAVWKPVPDTNEAA